MHTTSTSGKNETLSLFRKYLSDRGIQAQTAEVNDVRMASPEETAKAVGDFLPAVVWEYGDGYQRFRFLGDSDLFPKDPDSGKPIKCKARKGSGNRLYQPYHPNCTPSQREAMCADPSVPLVIVEGEADCLGVLQAEPNAVVVGIAGCYNWKTKKDPILPELKNLVKPGRAVILCPDSDWQHNPNVYAGWQKLGTVLKQLGGKVTVKVIAADPGDKLGAGDFIHKRGVEAWAALERIPLNEWSEKGRTLHRQKQGTPPGRGTWDAPQQDPPTLDTGSAGAGDPEADAEPPEDSPAGFYYRCRKKLLGSDRWIHWDGSFYRWGGTHYQRVSHEFVKSFVWSFAANYQVERKGRGGATYKAYPFATPSYIRNAVEWIQFSCLVAEVNPPGINCSNGFLELNWEGDRLIPHLLPHSPDRYVLNPPSCEYDPKADPSEYERLMQCLDPLPRQIWERTIAASLDLSQVRKYRGRAVKALLLKGSGANGKDTLRAITQQLLGAESMANTSTTDWQSYDDGSYFKVAGIRGKRLSWASETSDVGRIEQLQGLKAAITGDPITIEQKYKDATKEALATVFLFSINETPNIRTTLKAISSRWGLIPFEKTYSDAPKEGELLADPRFKEDPSFIRERILPAFLNTLLRQLQAVVREGIDYSATQEMLEEISRENNHLQQFAQEVGLSYEPDSRIPVAEIWSLLEKWYQDNAYLSYHEGPRGGRKAVWQEPGSRFDRLVKAPHQVVQRFTQIFPACRRQVHREPGTGRMVTYLAGLSLAEPFSQKLGAQTLHPEAESQGNGIPVNPVVNPVNPMPLQGSHLEALQDKACEPCEPCEPSIQEKLREKVNGADSERRDRSVAYTEFFSPKQGSQGSQASEPLQDKAFGCEPSDRQGSQQTFVGFTGQSGIPVNSRSGRAGSPARNGSKPREMPRSAPIYLDAYSGIPPWAIDA